MTGDTHADVLIDTPKIQTSRILQITAAPPGWWMVVRLDNGVEEALGFPERRRFWRLPVGAWALVDHGDHQNVEPMTEGDFGLVTRGASGFEYEYYAEVTTTELLARCHCGRRTPDDENRDRWWCEHCPGLISTQSEGE